MPCNPSHVKSICCQSGKWKFEMSLPWQEVVNLLPRSGPVPVSRVEALVERWQQRWPSPQHLSASVCLTAIHMRHLLLDHLWKQMPNSTEAQRQERQVPTPAVLPSPMPKQCRCCFIL